MVKFSNCVYVFVFFAFISLLAFYPTASDKPAHTEKAKAGLTSPVPQKAGIVVEKK